MSGGGAGAGASPANVSVFNAFGEPVTGLSVAGYSAGDIAAPADGATPPGVPRFTPACLLVPRTRNPVPSAAFAVGDNAVIAPWDSFRATFTVTIPDPRAGRVALGDPLVLALSTQVAVLLDRDGFPLAAFPVVLKDMFGRTWSGR